MPYQIKYLREAIEQLAKIPRNIRNGILDAIDERLSTYPERFKPLRGNLVGYYRLRVGKYRVVYKICDETITVLIIRINTRSEVYK